MNGHDLDARGSDVCPMCVCAGCANWLDQCTCPTLPIDTEDDE